MSTVLNLDRAREMIDDADMLREISGTMAEMLESELPEVCGFADRGELMSLARGVHKWNGCLSMFAHQEVVALAASVEQLAKADDRTAATEKFSTLAQHIRTLCGELREYVAA